MQGRPIVGRILLGYFEVVHSYALFVLSGGDIYAVDISI